MNYDSSSSTSSDEIYDYMVMDFLQENNEMQVVEDTIKYVVNSAVQQINESRQGKRERKKRVVVPRDREAAHDRLVADYFSDHPLYKDDMFCRRFRMRKHVFLRIVNTLSENDQYFQQLPDVTMRLGASALQKCTAAMRMLAYECSADQVDEYLKLGPSTARQCLIQFVDGVISQFSSKYLRKPTVHDIDRLLREGEERGFLGMIGSIDCMHWQWKNCPTGWKEVQFSVNGHNYEKGYYLTNGIYPKWGTFIDAITAPQTRDQKLFTKLQESVRKDVEHAFGVLQARFAIIRRPALAWNVELLWKIMMACIIIHNMIVEDERDNYANYKDLREFTEEQPKNIFGSASSSDNGITFTVTPGRFKERNLSQFMSRRDDVRDRETHFSLKNDLVRHIWAKFGSETQE